jgi:hypothetical protein
LYKVTIASLCPFVVDGKLAQSRLPSTAAMMLTSINMRWAVGKSLPTVSYLTKIDMYSIGSIVLIVAQLIYHALYGLINQIIEPRVSFWLDKGAFIFFLTLIFMKQVIFFGWIAKMIHLRKGKKMKGPKIENVAKKRIYMHSLKDQK